MHSHGKCHGGWDARSAELTYTKKVHQKEEDVTYVPREMMHQEPRSRKSARIVPRGRIPPPLPSLPLPPSFSSSACLPAAKLVSHTMMFGLFSIFCLFTKNNDRTV